MPYIDASYMKLFMPGRSTWVTNNGSAFTVMVNFFSGEFNQYMDVDADICSISDTTMESYTVGKAMADIVDANITHNEATGHLHPNVRINMLPPSIYEPKFSHIKTLLLREKFEEKPKCYNYNLRTGQIRRWT